MLTVSRPTRKPAPPSHGLSQDEIAALAAAAQAGWLACDRLRDERMSLDDAEFVRLCRVKMEGKAAADRLALRWMRDARRLARKLYWGKLDPDEVESAIGLSLDYTIRHFDPSRGKFTTLLYWSLGSQMKNVAKHYRRERADEVRRVYVGGLDGEDFLLESATYDPEPDEHPDYEPERLRDVVKKMRACRNRVVARKGEILWLYYWDGLTDREVGARLGITKQRACHLRMNAVDALRSVRALHVTA